MKNVFTIILLFLSVALISQSLMSPLPITNGKVIYTNVIKMDSCKQGQLYANSKKWFVNSFKSSNDVIQLDDKENGEIIGKGNFQIMWQSTAFVSLPVTVSCVYKISVKDGKYKYEFTDYRVKFHGTGSNTNIYNMTIEDFSSQFGKKGKEDFFLNVDRLSNEQVISLNIAMKEKQTEW